MRNGRLLKSFVVVVLAFLGVALLVYELRQDVIYFAVDGFDLSALARDRDGLSPALKELVLLWQEQAVASHAGDVGLSKMRILEIHGEPRVREGPIALAGWPKESLDADENWLYTVGSRYLLLCFSNGFCTYASFYPYKQDLDYQYWKAEQIETLAPGRSQSQVIELFGQPERYIQRKASDAPRLIDEPWREFDGQIFNEEWRFLVGDSLSVHLQFHGGKCDVIDRSMIFH